MSMTQAASVSGISRSELYRRIESGVLRARWVNSVMRVHVDDLRAMINALPLVNEVV